MGATTLTPDEMLLIAAALRLASKKAGMPATVYAKHEHLANLFEHAEKVAILLKDPGVEKAQ